MGCTTSGSPAKSVARKPAGNVIRPGASFAGTGASAAPGIGAARRTTKIRKTREDMGGFHSTRGRTRPLAAVKADYPARIARLVCGTTPQDHDASGFWEP